MHMNPNSSFTTLIHSEKSINMGKNLRSLLYLLRMKTSESAKLKKLLSNAVIRISFLRNRHRIMHSQAFSDVLQLLQNYDFDSALHRVGYVIEQRRRLEALAEIADCCVLLEGKIEAIVKSNIECPDEVKEAVSSLIFAASRCGGVIPELDRIRYSFTAKYGKEFARSAVELRNNCRVNLQMIKSLSKEAASLESRQNLLYRICREDLANKEKAMMLEAEQKHHLQKEEMEEEKGYRMAVIEFDAGDVSRPKNYWLDSIK